jgi:signal transduction histidine kinase
VARPTWAKTSLTSSLLIALTAIGLSAFLLGFVDLALWPWTSDVVDSEIIGCGVGSAGVFVFAGLLAWGLRPSNRLGAIMAFAGFAFLVDLFSNLPGLPLYTFGIIVASLPLAVVVHLLLAFPTGTLRSRLARQTVISGYVVCLVLQIPLYLFGAAGVPLGLTERPALHTAGVWTQRSAGLAVMIVTTYILVRRWRDSSPGARRVLGPLYLYGVFAVLFVPVSGAVIGPELHWSPYLLYFTQSTEMAVVPVLFTIAVLRGGFARTGEVQELATWLAADASRQQTLVQGLAMTLGDPSVELVYWSGDQDGYVDRDGRPATLPGDEQPRATQEIRTQSRLVGAVIYDTTLNPDAEEVAAIGQVVALAVDRDRLTAELGVNREELRRSRARIVEAGQRERREVALALHDGLQGRLVMLSVRAARLASAGDVSVATGAEAEKLHRELGQAAVDLRDVVHRIMPAALIERGLRAALEDLVDRTPMRTSLSVLAPAERLPDYLEGLAYFVVAEALTNALKHSHGDHIAVSVTMDAETIRLSVQDNGLGGALVNEGLGLRAMQDRLDALGGTLQVGDGPTGGTHLVAVLPVLEHAPLH